MSEGPIVDRGQSRALIAQLKRSDIFRDYEQAFRETTGLPINLRPIESTPKRPLQKSEFTMDVQASRAPDCAHLHAHQLLPYTHPRHHRHAASEREIIVTSPGQRGY